MRQSGLLTFALFHGDLGKVRRRQPRRKAQVGAPVLQLGGLISPGPTGPSRGEVPFSH